MLREGSIRSLFVLPDTCLIDFLVSIAALNLIPRDPTVVIFHMTVVLETRNENGNIGRGHVERKQAGRVNTQVKKEKTGKKNEARGRTKTKS